MTQNEAAERLLRDYHKWTHEGIAVGLDAALAAERRATVERIRERVEELGEWYHQDNHITVRWIDISAILDEEAAR